MKNIKLLIAIATVGASALIFTGCNSDDPTADNSVNIFTVQQDKDLGMQVAAQIESDTSEYDVLSPDTFTVAYYHLNRIVDTILNSGKVRYRDEFLWRVRIIRDDSTLNAFCAPGGYIYVFTGLIRFLETEDELAGVIGHEIAHADRRHTTDQLTKQYGYSLLVDAVLGDQTALTTIAGNLLFLKYSRSNEEEADEFSVRYLCPTYYNAAGGAGFFEKLEALGGSDTPEFLSTHPNPEDRIFSFYNWKAQLGCQGENTNEILYEEFKSSLP